MSVYRLPFDNSNEGWNMGNGNFDDPVGGGHGLGQPFAWDFGYTNSADPDGSKFGTVFAARAGTVIDLRNDQTVVLTGSDPVLGPGNYILVAHADNTISAYDHLKVHSVKVKVGQYVEQGTALATVGNTGSTSGGVVHLHFECHTWWNASTTSGGASMLVHFQYGNTVWRPVDGGTFGADPVHYRQDGWRFCNKCSGLFFSYQGKSGVCPAGGPHVTDGGNYTISDDANAPGQCNWKYCKKCSGLFFAGNAGSKCPAKTPTDEHDGSLSNNYHMVDNVAADPGQHHWRWCEKCQGMWYGDAPTSKCPGNSGGPHIHSGSGDYSILLSVEDVQQNWRWCNKCQGLFFGANGSGACKAGNGHSSAGSGNYTLSVDVSPVNSNGPKQKGWQAGWRYCSNCGLLWMGHNKGSHCPKGGPHVSSKSGEYFLIINDTATDSGLGQVGWRWCDKCQGLWMGLNANSKCPADGQAHSSSGSGHYVLSVDNH